MKPKLSKLVIPERIPKHASPITYTCYGHYRNPQTDCSYGTSSDQGGDDNNIYELYGITQETTYSTERNRSPARVYEIEFCKSVSRALQFGGENRHALPMELVRNILQLSGLSVKGQIFSTPVPAGGPKESDSFFDIYMETTPLSRSMVLSTASVTIHTSNIEGQPQAGVDQNRFAVAVLRPQPGNVDTENSGGTDLISLYNRVRIVELADGNVTASTCTSSYTAYGENIRAYFQDGDTLGVLRFTGKRLGEVAELQFNTCFDPLTM